MIKIIKTASDHRAAMKRVGELMDKNPRRGSDDAEELLVMAQLVEIYEKQHHDIGVPDAISAIEFRMEQQGLSRKDMAAYLGSPSRVSEVLSGKRPLTVQMIQSLHRNLDIPLEPLVMGGILPQRKVMMKQRRRVSRARVTRKGAAKSVKREVLKGREA